MRKEGRFPTDMLNPRITLSYIRINNEGGPDRKNRDSPLLIFRRSARRLPNSALFRQIDRHRFFDLLYARFDRQRAF